MNTATLNASTTTLGHEATTTNNTIWVCERFTRAARSRGIFFSDNPLSYTMPVLILQTSVVALITTTLQLLLTPFGQSSFVPQMLGGLALGPSILGQIGVVQKYLFPPRTFYVSETIAFFGSMIFMFLIGVKIDLTSIVTTGKKTWAIALSCFVFPIVFTAVTALTLRALFLLPQENLYTSIFYVCFYLSSCSFHSTASHLADLKLLNSELGRLAVSSSMISGTISAVLITSVFSHHGLRKGSRSLQMASLSFLFLVAVIVFVCRPIIMWMIRRTPEGKPIKEAYIIMIFVMMLLSALFSELIGGHFMTGPILLGLAVPDGPPLGSALSEKLDALVSAVFLPLYFLFCGARFNSFALDATSFAVVQVLAISSFLGKIFGAMLPSLYCKMSVTDSLSLGLIMSAQGITQMLYLQGSMYLKIIDTETYGNVVISMIWLTGATTPLVKFLYDPSKRYLAINRRRTIEHASPDVELLLMACIHNEENTPSTSSKTNSLYSTHSQHIINAFRSYEQQNVDKLVVNLFSSISPYETMHDEVCMQAAEKRVSMLIVPFHRQWSSNGVVTESAHPIRAFNRQILRTAPCSVGILVDRGTLSKSNYLTSASFYSVGVLFIEGSDDREALVYAMRMADHPNVSVTVVRLIEPRRKSRNLMMRDPDGDLIHKFKVEHCIQIKRHDYREEVVRDSVEMISAIKSLNGCFDLIMVGRRHANGESSSLFNGMNEWNEYPELGVVGDMLVSSDSSYDGSVMVVQQQMLGFGGGGYHHPDFHMDSNNGLMNHHPRQERPPNVVEVPRDTRVWPMV
ncbi:cation/H(+) antiporter 15 [Arachis duranensis]|uniref:Cation/H(+) antiporter 15 n=1 Tax=Arachis duranensis TaxID=130453 RepID=A0A6P4AWA8_ARADU|nr:cation/H(+) antiporter 15 [Arachis duranensis]